MKPGDVMIGREYLIRVIVVEQEPGGNMLRAVTSGEGINLQVHPDELIEEVPE